MVKIHIRLLVLLLLVTVCERLLYLHLHDHVSTGVQLLNHRNKLLHSLLLLLAQRDEVSFSLFVQGVFDQVTELCTSIIKRVLELVVSINIFSRW